MKRIEKKRTPADERDEELGRALRQAASSFAGDGFRMPSARAAKRGVLPLAAAAAALAVAVSLGGIALAKRGSALRSSAEFAAWLLPERSGWVREAEGLEPRNADPTLEFLERLWADI